MTNKKIVALASPDLTTHTHLSLRGCSALIVGRGKLKDKTDNGESICFSWWKGKPCHTNPCPHKHVCRICEGPHPEEHCPNRG